MEVLIARGESVHQLHNVEEFPSGQREQTVNLSLFSFGGSNPPSSTTITDIACAISVIFISEIDLNTFSRFRVLFSAYVN